MSRLRISAIFVFSIGLLSFSCALFQKSYARENQAKALYDYYEQESIKTGWQKIVVTVNGLERKILWKGPRKSWKYGAIIVLHGGGGTYSNFGRNIPLGKPMVEFSDLAIKKGFAVVSLESTWDRVLDNQGRSYGKRWDCIARDSRKNMDLPFINRVLTEIIPKLRPADSAQDIFIPGISNGGFMTILAATHFPEKITAFAPVSAGDPYGTYIDLGTHPRLERPNAPGVFRDNETNKLIAEKGAALAKVYAREQNWPEIEVKEKPVFKQFHHQGDSAVDISCMRKAGQLLVKHGYRDDGPFILTDTGKRSIWKHFWQRAYNRPLLEFFIQSQEKR